jgi:hypothetical protein
MGMLRVKATTAVAGMWAGEEYDVPETDFIQLLLSVHHLVLIKDYDAEAPTLPDSGVLSIPESEPFEEDPKATEEFLQHLIEEMMKPGVEVEHQDDTATPLGEKDYAPE